MIGGRLACDDEGLEAAFFAPDDLPWDELAFRSTHEALREFLGRIVGRRRPSTEPGLKAAPLRDRHFFRQIDVLDRVEQRRAFLHRTLERLAAGDQAHAAGALVDHRGLDRFLQVALARRAPPELMSGARPM